MTPSWSLESFCASQKDDFDWSDLPDSSREFLHSIGLPSLHPFCTNFSSTGSDSDYYLDHENIPRQGPLQGGQYDFMSLQGVWDFIVTVIRMGVPSLAAMGELWLRFFAFAIAPLGICVLLQDELTTTPPLSSTPTSTPSSSTTTENQPGQELRKNQKQKRRYISLAAILSITASMVLLTDTLYVMEFGPQLGSSLLFLSSILAVRAARRHQLPRQVVASFFGLWILTACLIVDIQQGTLHFGHPQEWVDEATLQEGLYYDSNNEFVHGLVTNHWKESDRSYTLGGSSDGSGSSGTIWMPTGDARTGLPFLLNFVPEPKWHRIWLPVPNDANGNNRVHNHDHVQEEVVALDVSFPETGHDPNQPVYLLLHGLNGGSQEEYVKDFAWRRTSATENATVVVMIARGLMDLPVRGWDNFHGARWSDAHAASLALRRGMKEDQILAGVGYSMGAIILSNMVARTGADCALDAAVAISGGLDMRIQGHYARAQRVFQPILTQELRDSFLLGKWGERTRQRLTKEQLQAAMRATHITEIDEHAVVNYHGFNSLRHYYEEMSALGDVPLEEFETGRSISPNRRIHQVAIPFCVVHALDDPLITWRSVASPSGPGFPSNLTKTGSGHLLLLLTKRGGHVGWPLGMLPSVDKWKWMSNAASSFVHAVQQAKSSHSVRYSFRDEERGRK